jgi:aryl sulfotransferase
MPAFTTRHCLYLPCLWYARHVSAGLVHYRSPVEDSGRWLGFRFRPGDIVISTRPRTGTTWLQMICALLIFQGPELPAPLWQLSPWLDGVEAPLDYICDQLARQPHRRFIKTHTPLDGVPLDPRVTYIVTARHPLDTYVSLCQHNGIRPNPNGPHVPPAGFRPHPHGSGAPPGPPPRGSGPPFGPPPFGPPPFGPPPPGSHVPPGTSPPPAESPPGQLQPPASQEMLHDALIRWIGDDQRVRQDPSSLSSIMWHLSDAWSRRREPNVLLVRYEDLLSGLEDRMRWLADRLGIAVGNDAWPGLTREATFERMRERADTLVQAPPGVPLGNASFFRRGAAGAGREILSDEELAGYYERAARLAPPDMLDWLHAPPA